MSAGSRTSSTTVVVVQRERFGPTRSSLRSLFENTEPAFPLVYVDAGSPPRVRRWLAAEAKRRGFERIRVNHYLSPTEARNLAFAHVKTRYVVFVDNDVIFSPGWLSALEACADETAAGVVTPLTCFGEPVHSTIHLAGGEVRVTESGGRRHLREHQRFQWSSVEDMRGQLEREETELGEFHCMLVRADTFRKLGGIDESLLSTSEHIDFCLRVRDAGARIVFEPRSVVTYVSPPPLAPSDLGFYLLRWSDAWVRQSEHALQRKWDLASDRTVVSFGAVRRRIAFRRMRRAWGMVRGHRHARRDFDRLYARLAARAARGRPAAGGYSAG